MRQGLQRLSRFPAEAGDAGLFKPATGGKAHALDIESSGCEPGFAPLERESMCAPLQLNVTPQDRLASQA